MSTSGMTTTNAASTTMDQTRARIEKMQAEREERRKAMMEVGS
jgi:hypothetical protein